MVVAQNDWAPLMVGVQSATDFVVPLAPELYPFWLQFVVYFLANFFGGDKNP